MSKNRSKSVGFKRYLGQKTQLPKSFGLKIEVQKNLGKKIWVYKNLESKIFLSPTNFGYTNLE